MGFWNDFKKNMIQNNFQNQFNHYVDTKAAEYNGSIGRDIFISYYNMANSLLKQAKNGHDMFRLQMLINSANHSFENIQKFFPNYQMKKIAPKQYQYFTILYNTAFSLNLAINERTKHSYKPKLKYKKQQKEFEKKIQLYKDRIDGKI